mgnify:FL=1
MSKPAARAPAAKAAPKTAPKAVTPAAQRKAGEAAAEPASAYLVGDCPIQHDGVLYQPGHAIALTEAQADRLGNKVAAVAAAAVQPTILE